MQIRLQKVLSQAGIASRRAAEKLMVAKGVVTPDQLQARQFALAAAGPAHLLPTGR